MNSLIRRRYAFSTPDGRGGREVIAKFWTVRKAQRMANLFKDTDASLRIVYSPRGHKS